MTTLSVSATGALAGLWAWTLALMLESCRISLLFGRGGENARRDAQRQNREGQDERARPGELLLRGVGAASEFVDDERKSRHRPSRISRKQRVAKRGED